MFTLFGETVRFYLTNYFQPSNRLAVIIISCQSGEYFATLSINIPDVELGEDEFVVKMYNENEEVAIKAFRTGLFQSTGRIVKTEFVFSPIWKLNRVKFDKEVQRLFKNEEVLNA